MSHIIDNDELMKLKQTVGWIPSRATWLRTDIYIDGMEHLEHSGSAGGSAISGETDVCSHMSRKHFVIRS